jgi:enamine deaminase RidA (YjgF/YER057c/UK114 family)
MGFRVRLFGIAKQSLYVLPVYRSAGFFYSLGIPSLQELVMSVRDVVFPAGRQALYERNRYSPAIRSNGFLFVSGQVGSLPDGSPEPELEAQVRQAFENLNAILAAAGGSFEDVVDVTVFMVDPATRFERIWSVVGEFWGDAPHPTVTAVGVTWLYGFDFEIKVIARTANRE